MATDAWRMLLADGAYPQRLLWASTGVKDPELDPTTYAVVLAIPGTVTTFADVHPAGCGRSILAGA
jgi:transaldolase